MDPWRSQIRCSFYFSSQQCACFQVVVLAGAGRLPSSGSAPLSATALEHRVRHPASLWGSARHASGAQTRIRASNCASNRQRAGTMSAASSSPSPGPRCVCRLSHHCRWSRVMRPSPLLGWKHLAAARRCRTDSRFRCSSHALFCHMPVQRCCAPNGTCLVVLPPRTGLRLRLSPYITRTDPVSVC